MAKLQTTAKKARTTTIRAREILKLLCTKRDRHPNPSLYRPARLPAARGIGSGKVWTTLKGWWGSLREERRKNSQQTNSRDP
jgi:hypothetical protein